MAVQLRIWRSATELNSFLSSGINLLAEGFTFRSGSGGPVWMTFPFKAVGGGTEDSLRTVLTALDELAYWAQDYHADPLQKLPVWLEWNTGSEPARRTLVYEITYEITSKGPKITPLMEQVYVTGTCAVLVDPFYESISAGSSMVLSSMSGSGDIQRPTGLSATTTWLGRISDVQLQYVSGTAISELWLGIRPVNDGITNYNPKWEAENGTNLLGDTTDVADATASGGTKVQTTFASGTSLAARFSVRWGQIYGGADYDDIFGRYLVLARMKVDAGTTQARVQLRHGWIGQSGYENIAGEIYVDGVTGWRLFEIGYVDIPVTGNRVDRADSEVLNHGFVLHAERLSAGGSLDVDFLFLVPADHMIYGNGALINSSGGITRFFTAPDWGQYAVTKTASGGLWGNMEYNFLNWGLPIGTTCAVVFIGQQAGVHSLTSVVDVGIEYYPRFRGYRYV